MTYLPAEANCVFVDGPVSIFVHVSSEKEILEAIERLEKLVKVAAKVLHEKGVWMYGAGLPPETRTEFPEQEKIAEAAKSTRLVETPIAVQPEQGSMEDFGDAAALVDAFATCDTKGEMLGLVLAYRKKVLAALASSPAVQPDPAERWQAGYQQATWDAQDRAAVQAVPEGWRMVPIEPTEEMHAAAVRTAVRCTGNDDFPPRVWRAMLVSAPQAPAPEPKPDLVHPSTTALEVHATLSESDGSARGEPVAVFINTMEGTKPPWPPAWHQLDDIHSPAPFTRYGLWPLAPAEPSQQGCVPAATAAGSDVEDATKPFHQNELDLMPTDTTPDLPVVAALKRLHGNAFTLNLLRSDAIKLIEAAQLEARTSQYSDDFYRNRAALGDASFHFKSGIGPWDFLDLLTVFEAHKAATSALTEALSRAEAAEMRANRFQQKYERQCELNDRLQRERDALIEALARSETP